MCKRETGMRREQMRLRDEKQDHLFRPQLITLPPSRQHHTLDEESKKYSWQKTKNTVDRIQEIQLKKSEKYSWKNLRLQNGNQDHLFQLARPAISLTLVRLNCNQCDFLSYRKQSLKNRLMKHTLTLIGVLIIGFWHSSLTISHITKSYECPN